MFFLLSTQSLLYNLFTFSFLLRFTSFFVLFALKRRFILCTRDSGNAMRFSLRNSRVKISFLYLRGLFALFSSPFLHIPSYPFLISHHLFATPLKRALTDEWNIFCYSLYMRRMLASPHSISFYRAKKSIAFLLLLFILFYSLLYSREIFVIRLSYRLAIFTE